MTQTEILAQFERMTPRQQKDLLQRLQKTAQKSEEAQPEKVLKDDDLTGIFGALRRANDLPDEEPKLLTAAEKQALRVRLREELAEGAYAPLEETEEQRYRRLAAIPPADAMTGVIQGKSGEVPNDEEIKEDYIKHLLRKYS